MFERVFKKRRYQRARTVRVRDPEHRDKRTDFVYRSEMPKPKKLIAVGNSYAVVIERPLMRALQVSRRTTFKVFTDGQRIILEPLPMATNDPTNASVSKGLPLDVRRPKALQIAAELIRRGLDHNRMERMGAGRETPYMYLEHVKSRQTLDPVLEMMMDRAAIVHDHLERNETWDAAIEAACNSVPDVPGAGDLGMPFERMRRMGLTSSKARPNSSTQATIPSEPRG